MRRVGALYDGNVHIALYHEMVIADKKPSYHTQGKNDLSMTYLHLDKILILLGTTRIYFKKNQTQTLKSK